MTAMFLLTMTVQLRVELTVIQLTVIGIAQSIYLFPCCRGEDLKFDKIVIHEEDLKEVHVWIYSGILVFEYRSW